MGGGGDMGGILHTWPKALDWSGSKKSLEEAYFEHYLTLPKPSDFIKAGKFLTKLFIF